MKPVEGDLRVWWIPQIPGKPFLVSVRTLHEAKLLTTSLALYDLFQFIHHIKPDYSNVGGCQIFQDGKWVDFWTEDGEEFDKLNECQINDLDTQRAERRKPHA